MRRLYWLALLFRMEKQKQRFTGALGEDAGKESAADFPLFWQQI